MTAGTRRAVVALDAKTGEQIWVYSLDEGKRAEMAPRVLSGRGCRTGPTGRATSESSTSRSGIASSIDAKTGQPIPTFGKDGMVDLKEGVVYGKLVNGTWQQGRSRSSRANRDQLDPAGRRRRHRRAVRDGRRAPLRIHQQRQGSRAGLRCSDRQAALALRHDARPRRIRPRNLGKRLVELDGQHGVWTEMSATPTRPGLPAGRIAHDRRLRRESSGQPACSPKPRRRRLKTGEEVALPDRASRSLGLRPDRRTAPDGRHDRRQAAQDHRPAEQAGWLYTFDRVTGEPIWPIVENPVPQSDVPGEKTRRRSRSRAGRLSSRATISRKTT